MGEDGTVAVAMDQHAPRGVFHSSLDQLAEVRRVISLA